MAGLFIMDARGERRGSTADLAGDWGMARRASASACARISSRLGAGRLCSDSAQHKDEG